MKRLKKCCAAFLSLLLLLGTAVPVRAAGGEEGKLQVTPESVQVESGGTREFTVTGEGMEEEVVVKLKDLLGENEVEHTVTRVSDREQRVQVSFPENPTDWDKAYTLNFYRAGSSQIACTAQVTVLKEGGQAEEAVVHYFSADKTTAGQDGNRTVTFTVYGSGLTEMVNVQVSLEGDDQELSPVFTEVTPSKQTFTLEFPENTEGRDLTYEVKTSPAGKGQWSVPVGITIKAQQQGEQKPLISSIVSQPLGEDGLTYQVSFEGENLTEDNVYISVLPEENVLITGKVVRKDGGEFIVTFPENTTGAERTYTLYIGTASGQQKEETFVIKSSSGEEDQEEVDLKPGAVFIDDTYREITMTFGKPVQSAVENEAQLKEGISLLYGAQWNPLSEDDVVSIEGRTIRIQLADAYQPIIGPMKISIGKGVLETTDEKLVQPFEWLIDDKARVTGIEVTPEILSSEGGEVTALLKGYHLQDAKILGRIIDVRTGIENPDIDVYTEKSEDGRPVLRYTVPSNKSGTTQCWLLKVEVNGVTVAEGMDYTDVAKRPLVSVLPAEASPQDITLGNMTINSYGNNPNPDDLQYTNTADNQESKKVQVHLYGTNLDAEKTKVKIVDENGIEWPVYNVPQFDSVTYFIMVANDGTGITGDGNHQILEIICPRNIGCNEEYDIYVSVDGENYIEDQHVTVCVRNEGESSILTPDVRTVEVQYVDTEGKQIASSTQLRGYAWFFMADMGIEAKQIEGYKAVKVPVFTELKETLGDQDRTLQIVYEKEKGQTTDPGTDPVTPPGEDPDKKPAGDPESGTQGSGQPAGQPGGTGAGGNGQQATVNRAARTGDKSHAGAAAAGMALAFVSAAVVVKRRNFSK